MNKGTVLYEYELDKSDNGPPGDNNSKVTGAWMLIIFGGAVNNGTPSLSNVKWNRYFPFGYLPVWLIYEISVSIC